MPHKKKNIIPHVCTIKTHANTNLTTTSIYKEKNDNKKIKIKEELNYCVLYISKDRTKDKGTKDKRERKRERE